MRSMDRVILYLSFVLLVVVKILSCVVILLFLILFSPILLFGNEDKFLTSLQKLHDYINNE